MQNTMGLGGMSAVKRLEGKCRDKKIKGVNFNIDGVNALKMKVNGY